MATVKPIPDGYPRVIPYLMVDDANAAIEFYKNIFGATERMRMPGPDDMVMHAEVAIGDSLVMLADVTPDMGPSTPSAIGGTPVTIMVYVEDVDDVYRRAIEAGASEDRPLEDQFYGDRSGSFVDPFGHKWHVASHVEDVAEDEMQRRMEAMMSS